MTRLLALEEATPASFAAELVADEEENTVPDREDLSVGRGSELVDGRPDLIGTSGSRQ